MYRAELAMQKVGNSLEFLTLYVFMHIFVAKALLLLLLPFGLCDRFRYHIHIRFYYRDCSLANMRTVVDMVYVSTTHYNPHHSICILVCELCSMYTA